MTEKEVASWRAGHRNEPVWRDGLDSTLSYLIVAVQFDAKTYNCVCIRKFDDDSYKLKCYPDFKSWKFSESILDDLGAVDFLDRSDKDNMRDYAGYQRCFVSREVLARVLKRLRAQQNVTTITLDLVDEAFKRPHNTRQSSRDYHPVRGGRMPETPYEVKEKLED